MIVAFRNFSGVLTQSYLAERIAIQAISFKEVLSVGFGIWDERLGEFVGAQIKIVGDDNVIHFASGRACDFDKVAVSRHVAREDQGPMMCRAICKGKWSWRNIHLTVPYQDVAVAPDTTETFVFVHIRTVGVQEAAVADY